jgi:hypothetical protein
MQDFWHHLTNIEIMYIEKGEEAHTKDIENTVNKIIGERDSHPDRGGI